MRNIAHFRGKYLKGWDKLREEKLARMKEMGIVHESTELPPSRWELYDLSTVRTEVDDQAQEKSELVERLPAGVDTLRRHRGDRRLPALRPAGQHRLPCHRGGCRRQAADAGEVPHPAIRKTAAALLRRASARRLRQTPPGGRRCRRRHQLRSRQLGQRRF